VAVGAIGAGSVVLLGVGPDDTERSRTTHLQGRRARIFRDDEGRTNRRPRHRRGGAVVSQSTLFADTTGA
jgi:D-Tyr-tRNAtyr deacylase